MAALAEKVLHSKEHLVVKALGIDFHNIRQDILRLNDCFQRGGVYDFVFPILRIVEPMLALGIA